MARRGGIVSRLKRRKIQEVVVAGKRMDGRGLEDYREIELKTGVLEKAEGSAEVRLGKTWVLAGVKVGVGTPFEDTPDVGVLMCNAEFTPVAHPTFEPGPPDEESIELARVVDRGLRSAEILDFGELALIPGKQVYLVHVDLYVLNYDGNLIDASALAAIAALKTATRSVYDVKEGEIQPTEKRKPLKVLKEPVAVTMVKIGDSLIVDPSADEEEVMDMRLTLTLDGDGNICTIQKSGSEGLTMEEIKNAIRIATEKAAENRKLIAGTG
ncbi:MAG: exosome complex protein Rrp42 [Candidatus Bathyarchaeota archaeon]|jgi:exosome complex component RRP42|nr:exosome complex protein Rrp42 [Candidatus Bathyarchaeota archaeon]